MVGVAAGQGVQQALDERDPVCGIAQLAARRRVRGNPNGVTRTKALGRERIARKLSDSSAATIASVCRGW